MKRFSHNLFSAVIGMVAIVSMTLAPYFAFAQILSEDGKDALLNRLNDVANETYEPGTDAEGQLGEAIVTVINMFLGILGVLFVILMIYAGFLWMTARGNDDQVHKAQDLIRNAIIGVIIVVAAYAITTFVLGALIEGATGGGTGGGTR